MRSLTLAYNLHSMAALVLLVSVLLWSFQLTNGLETSSPETTTTSNPPLNPNQRVSPARHNQSSSVCPTGWRPATSSGQEFWGGQTATASPTGRGVAPKVCVWVNEDPTPWREALSVCRRRNGFLVKLETILELEGGRDLLEDIRVRGLDTVWTGMHHSRGVLLWDELKPSMVTPYFGPTRQYGKKKRHWDFDNKSFLNGRGTCGALSVNDPDSSSQELDPQSSESPSTEIFRSSDVRPTLETSERHNSYLDSLIPFGGSGTVMRRRRRSTLQAPGDPFIPLPPLSDVVGTPQGFKPDSDDGATNQSPTQEAKIENFQQFLSNQGFQERYVESIGETPQTNDQHGAKKQDDVFILDSVHPHLTTLRPTTTTDQSNLEDDDHHVVTKRDTSASATAAPSSKLSDQQVAAATTTTPTSAPKFSQQNSVKGTSLPASTQSQGETTKSPPEPPKTVVDDFINRLLQVSFVGAASDQRQPLQTQVNAPQQSSVLRLTKQEGRANMDIQDTFNTAASSNTAGSPLEKPMPEALREGTSHSQHQQVALDMLTPQSKVVLPPGNSPFSSSSSSSSHNSSDTSSSFPDSNEFLTQDRKKAQDDMFAFPQNLVSLNEAEDPTTTTTTTESPDDSHEVTDSFSSAESSTETPETNNTLKQSKEYSSREMVELWGSDNNTNSLHKHSDLDPNQKSILELDPDILLVDSAEIFDSPTSLNSSSEEISGSINSTSHQTLHEFGSHSDSEWGSSRSSNHNDVFDVSGLFSDEKSKDSNTNHLEQLVASPSGPTEPENYMELENCQEEHPSVCVTEAIEELTLVGHCDRGWYGHRLLDRCYRPIGFKLTEFEARQKCLQRGAVLAMADTEFYGNVLALLLQYVQQERRFEPTIWVDAGLNLAVQADGSCWTLYSGSLAQETCTQRQSFFCQKDSRFHGFNPRHLLDKVEPDTYVHNMTSFHPQTLFCPLQVFAVNDQVIWFKDGRPVRDLHGDEERGSFGFKNGQLSNSLDLDLSILRRIGPGGDRIPKPAMLQGTYWCEVWRRSPALHRVASHKIFLKFSDMLTLHGYILTETTDYVEAAMFNSMGLMIGLPVAMERRLATINKNLTHQLRATPLLVRDVITFIKRVRASDGKFEFVTYINLSTGDLSTHMRRVITDQYIASFRQILQQQEAEITKEWNIEQPLETAVKVFMTDFCPETDLTDKRTGRSANFPSTPTNTKALSTDKCNGMSTGRAWCRGDLQTGAFWDNIRVTRSCQGWEWQDSSSAGSEDDSSDGDNFWDVDGFRSKVDDSSDERDGLFVLEKAPNSALLELDEIEIEEANVADVTERLTNVLDDLEELSESDVSAVAQVVDHIVAVSRPPTEVSDKLVQTVSKVMDAHPDVLKKAEDESRALSRLVLDMEKFGEKVDMGVDPVVRHVTPNVAMELWSLEDAGEDVVIGLGATETGSWAAPLSDPRIVTIKNRKWAEQNLPNFDIAIELPESLVRNTVRYSDTALRLSMFIYRKSSLFVNNNQHLNGPDPGRGDVSEPSGPPGEVNSAIISASLGGRRVQGLEEKIRLVFKPLRVPEEEEDWATHCVFWDDGGTRHQDPGLSARRGHWSDEGCVYNGTLNGRHVCLCDHLTNFAVLLDFYGERRAVSAQHETSLSIITLVGISFSIFGLAMTVITFVAFKKLRQGRAQQTLLNMALSLLCFQTVFLLGVKQTSVWPVCLGVAVLLHYFILVSFAWMLIEAVLQYLTFVKVLGTYISRYTLKTVLPAWGFPLLPVAAVLVTDYNLYLGRTDYCWMDLQAFYYAFALPVGIIIVFNLIMFLVIITSLVTRPKGLRSNQASSKARETNLKAAVTIFILLGLTWMFGYLAIEDARLPFQYVFTVLSSLQGFLIFVLMVVRRRQVRDQWRQMCCVTSQHQPRRQKKLSPVSSSSTTSNNSVSNSRTLPSFINHTYHGMEATESSIPPFPLPPPALRRQKSIHV